MIDKEKQIEEIAIVEIASDIHTALLNCNNNYNCRSCEFRNDTPMSFCKAEYIAKAIVEKYQPKIDKDSVVITREEYAEYVELRNSEVAELVKENKALGKQCLDWMKLYHKQLTKTKETSKETANKLISKIREMLNSCETVYEDDEYLISPNEGYLMKDVDTGLDEIEKQFSIEMKE